MGAANNEYEVARAQRINDNLKKAQAMGLVEACQELAKSSAKPRVVRAPIVRTPGARGSLEGAGRRSGRVASLASRPDYREMTGGWDLPRAKRTSGGAGLPRAHRPSALTWVPPLAYSEALDAASRFLRALDHAPGDEDTRHNDTNTSDDGDSKDNKDDDSDDDDHDSGARRKGPKGGGKGAADRCLLKIATASQISGGFWMGLQARWCDAQMPPPSCRALATCRPGGTGCLVVLEDAQGREWESIYKPDRTAFSGGWRGFALDQRLQEGDAVVFERAAHDAHRVKVHIFRACEQPSALAKRAQLAEGGEVVDGGDEVGAAGGPKNGFEYERSTGSRTSLVKAKVESRQASMSQTNNKKPDESKQQERANKTKTQKTQGQKPIRKAKAPKRSAKKKQAKKKWEEEEEEDGGSKDSEESEKAEDEDEGEGEGDIDREEVFSKKQLFATADEILTEDGVRISSRKRKLKALSSF
eukprot:jgi/Mesen1/5663/ME000287S04922